MNKELTPHQLELERVILNWELYWGNGWKSHWSKGIFEPQNNMRKSLGLPPTTSELLKEEFDKRHRER